MYENNIRQKAVQKQGGFWKTGGLLWNGDQYAACK